MADRYRSNSGKLELLLLIAVIVLGVAVTRQYGESWDEQQFFKYADRALESYGTWWGAGTVQLTGNTYDNYGPAYVMLVAIAAKVLGLIVPWSTSDLRHLVYFATFVVGIWSFHRLCGRWLGRGAALGATLLFASQPLIWGHAFISPKDLPFLTFFLLTLLLGFQMVDRQALASPETIEDSARPRRFALVVVWGLLVLGVLAATPIANSYLQSLVQAAAQGQSNAVSWLARDLSAATVNVYAQKFFAAYLWARGLLVLITAGSILFASRKTPDLWRLLVSVAPAAVILGITTSMRLVGPMGGLAVAAYAIWKLRRRAIPLLIGYGLISVATMYATWPYLWPNPVGHLLESASLMSQYPWRGQVLYNGATYSSTALPRAYLPVLLGIQLTEPVWIFFAAGLIVAILEAVKGSRAALALILLVAVWFVLPVLGFVVAPYDLYDNARQLLFILPAVFLMAGVAFNRIKNVALQGALITAVLLPGLIDGVRLHPYEYIYYNRFIGGEQGAFRRFEADYWGTSFREGAAYLNQIAPANSTVWVDGPTHILQVYVRPDLKIYSTYEAERADHYDFVVALSRSNLDVRSFPQAPVVHAIERDGAILTVIKKP